MQLSDRSGIYDIYVMNIDGPGLVRLTDTPAFDGAPTWSPNGLSIAFAAGSGTGLDNQIFAMNADGSEAIQLAGTLVGSSDPDW